MNVDKKSLILGSMIGLLTMAGIAYAQSYYYSIGIVVQVPEGAIEISGTSFDNYGNRILPKLTLQNNQASCVFTIRNTGSKDYIITKTINAPSSMDVTLEAYVEHSTGGDAWIGGVDSFVLGRGKSADIELTVVDLGSDVGVYDIQIAISAEPS